MKIARWTPEHPVEAAGALGKQRFVLDWIAPEEITPSTARFVDRDAKRGGAWSGKLGARAVWIPAVKDGIQNGYRMLIDQNPCTWLQGTRDTRVLQAPGDPAAARTASCWFAAGSLNLSVTPPDAKPYRLTIYLLDFDRDGRAMEARLRDEMGIEMDRQKVSQPETDTGVYLTWTIAGPVKLELKKLSGYNVVVSGVFVDPASE